MAPLNYTNIDFKPYVRAFSSDNYWTPLLCNTSNEKGKRLVDIAHIKGDIMGNYRY